MRWIGFALALLMPGGLFLYAFGMWYAGVTPRQLVKGIKDGRPIETSPKYAEWARKMEAARKAQATEDGD